MDRKDQKQQIQRRYDDLRRSGATEVGIFRELVSLLHEEAKTRLVDAIGDDIARLQGEAKAFERVYNELRHSASADNQEQRP